MRIEESDQVMRAAGVEGSTPRFHRGGAGSTPSAALHDLEVRPVANVLAKTLIQRHHYLHTFPVGTVLCFGVFVGDRMVGALTLGVGPTNGHRLVQGAGKDDGLTLTRFWLADGLPPNSASHVLGVVIRALRSKTEVKFLLTYADPTPEGVLTGGILTACIIGLHKVISMGAWTMALFQIPFIFNFSWSIWWGKKVTSDNPWEATTLEWAAPSPPPHGNFATVPVTYRGPYEYSVPDAERDFSPQFQETI